SRGYRPIFLYLFQDARRYSGEYTKSEGFELEQEPAEYRSPATLPMECLMGPADWQQARVAGELAPLGQHDRGRLANCVRVPMAVRCPAFLYSGRNHSRLDHQHVELHDDQYRESGRQTAVQSLAGRERQWFRAILPGPLRTECAL